MAVLYVTSPGAGGGKTAVCAGLGKHLLDGGKKVGFFKPVITEGNNLPTVADGDALFMKELLALGEGVELISPVLGDGRELSANLKKAFGAISRDKDVVIIEGVSGQHQASRDIVEALDARVIIVEDFSDELPGADSYQDLTGNLLGIVLNKIPRSRLEKARSGVATRPDKTYILGILPEDRALLTVSIGELAEHIHGEIFSGAEQAPELLENFMVGAMIVDPGPVYFGRKANKAVIARSGRPDVQMAALETSTRCLVLTGKEPLNPLIIRRAEEKGVPIILAGDTTIEILNGIEDTLAGARFRGGKKLPRLLELMEQQLDFQQIYRGLGLAG